MVADSLSVPAYFIIVVCAGMIGYIVCDIICIVRSSMEKKKCVINWRDYGVDEIC
jgi:hypothetical protein